MSRSQAKQKPAVAQAACARAAGNAETATMRGASPTLGNLQWQLRPGPGALAPPPRQRCTPHAGADPERDITGNERALERELVSKSTTTRDP